MSDYNKVLDAWQNCMSSPKCKDCPWEECEYEHEVINSVPLSLILDTVTLLKGQKPVKPKENGFSMPATIIFNYECECGGPVMREQPHCMKCGKELLWE